MALLATWLLPNAVRFVPFACAVQAFEEIMEVMEPGKNVALMIMDKRSGLFLTPVYLRFLAWYQATRHGIVDFNFADFRPQIVRNWSESGPRIGEELTWTPWQFQWDRDGGEK